MGLKLETVLSSLKLDASYSGVLAPHWDDSMETLPSPRPDFLDAAAIREYGRRGSLSAETIDALVSVAARIDSDPALTAFVWHLFRRLFIHTDDGGFPEWPYLDAVLGEDVAAPYLLVGLGMVPLVADLHRSMNVPESVTNESLGQLYSFSYAYYKGNGGRLGIYPRVVGWLRHYTAGRLFRLGRMEYMIWDAKNSFVFPYRNVSTGTVIALAKDGLRFTEDGFLNRPSDDNAPGFVSSLTDDGRSVTGMPVSPYGFALNAPVTLPLDTWKPVLDSDTKMLDMHIPAGGRLTPEACIDSIRRGFAFFDEYFPNDKTVGVRCSSWIFSPSLERILKPTANLVAFIRNVYLHPVPSTCRSSLFHIFYGHESDDLSTLPRETSVQRAVLDFIESGGCFRSSGMFFLRDDLDDFGMRHYRSQWSDPSVAPV